MVAKKEKVFPVRVVYQAAGGSKKLGNFYMNTPSDMKILESVLSSPDGKTKAVFSHANHAGKYCNIRVTHGPHRGLGGDLDATARRISGDPTTSGWLFWRIAPPKWFAEQLEKLEAERASKDSKKATAKKATAKKATAEKATAKKANVAKATAEKADVTKAFNAETETESA